MHRKTNSVQRTYFINENNGVYYCGAETLNSVYQYSYPAILTSTITFHVFYTSPSKVCTIQTINDDKIDQGCKCSEVGNPSNGGEYCGSAL